MNKTEAKRWVDIVTLDELKLMFISAYNEISDWGETSTLNKGMSKGAVFNVLTKAGIHQNMSNLVKINMIREFGEYLPNYKKSLTFKKPKPKVYHEAPQMLDSTFLTPESFKSK